MSFETREEVLEKVMAMPKPKCPHCGVEMSLWEEPAMRFGDGLGWGTPYLFVCFNDNCELYQSGWKHIEENLRPPGVVPLHELPRQRRVRVHPGLQRHGDAGSDRGR